MSNNELFDLYLSQSDANYDITCHSEFHHDVHGDAHLDNDNKDEHSDRHQDS